MGPLNNQGVAEKMDRHVEDAIELGATVHVGGRRADGFPTDLFYEPTVIGDVSTEMLVNTEESFGPISPIIEFTDYEEAVEIANGIDLGLAAGVFTNDAELMRYFAENLEMGLVNINSGSASWEIHTPFGGYSGKQSGKGRVGGHEIIEEMSQKKTITMDIDTEL